LRLETVAKQARNAYAEIMSKQEKLLARFKSIPADFTFEELTTLLQALGYIRVSGGKTGGSRVEFRDTDSGAPIKLHKPHPGNIVKKYALEQLKEYLEGWGKI